MVSVEKKMERDEEVEEGKGERIVTNLEDEYSSVCPGCGYTLDFWACEALCHHCGLKFTCDE